VVFAPTVNIMRTPLGGRTFEGYGEDPFLVSRIAVGWIRGAQGEGVIADAKHFAANNQEGLAPEPPPGAPIGLGLVGDRVTVEAALAAGLASPVDVDEHVRRILRTLFAFGAFDRAAYVDDDAQIDKQGHADAAGEVEEAAITLLENSGALPLDASTLTSVAIIGSDADRFQSRGGSAGIR